ncbi:ileal sodium/bile acid cotransporter-like [Haliotis rubra]|uniref:ileal sodium/bile acid cotransporter-like n=1 Tax=Haliotis rubra TaxID=36100 RepID=UPI001EE52274|nr:ileal sodium/bile acid cotransporter-like [Haliotis rubra]
MNMHVVSVVCLTLLLSVAASSTNNTFLYIPWTNADISFNSTYNTTSDFRISVSPSPSVHMFMEASAILNVSYFIVCDSPDRVYNLSVYTTENKVAFLAQPGDFSIRCNNISKLASRAIPLEKSTRVSGTFSINLRSDLIGRTWLVFETDRNRSSPQETQSDTETTTGQPENNVQRYMIVVTRNARPIDTVFNVVMYLFVIASTIGMGCKIELGVVKSVLRKPVAPAVGFFCQYLVMPLIAFGVAKLVTFDIPAVGLGIFACGICPGGGASNIYSYLLGGDLSLSATMTTISNIGALGMVPLWMFTLGQQFHDDKMQINIPYANIIQTLASVILPIFVGIIIKYKFQKVAAVIVKVLKPVTLITIVILLTFGIYANLFIFRLFKPSTFLAGCLLPYCGYIIGGLVGLMFRQPWYRVKTIAIETGIQNVMVAYLMLQLALPPPDGDLAAVGPLASAVMTPLPLFVLAIGYTIYLKCTKHDDNKISKRERVEMGGCKQEEETVRGV